MPLPKYLERQLARPWPRLLVAKEKHTTRHFLVPDRETLFKISLKLLKERKQEGWFYAPTPFTPDPEMEALWDIATLPQKIQQHAVLAKREYQQRKQQYVEDSERWSAIVRALQGNDGEAAWAILDARSDYEYESVVLQAFDKV